MKLTLQFNFTHLITVEASVFVFDSALISIGPVFEMVGLLMPSLGSCPPGNGGGGCGPKPIDVEASVFVFDSALISTGSVFERVGLLMQTRFFGSFA